MEELHYLNKNAYKILLYLRRNYPEDGAFITSQELKNEVQISTRAVRNSLKELESYGHITITYHTKTAREIKLIK